MLKTTRTVGVLVLGIVLSACATHEDTGRVIGGILGGVAGSQVGDGHGRTAATVVGTIAGAAIGGSIGKHMDDTDRLKARHALENNRTYESSSWHNPDTYFQSREASNAFYLACPEIVSGVMDRFAEQTGRRYHLFDYFGDASVPLASRRGL